MPDEYVGYRLLYNALSCGLEGQEEFGVGFTVGDDLRVEVYLGPRPRFGLLVDESSDRYFAPVTGIPASMGEISYARDPSELDYPHSFFCEVACFKSVEVSRDLSEAFHRQEQEAKDRVLALVEKHEEQLKETTGLFAGVVGLRFHRRLVLELINENAVALLLDENDEFVQRFAGRVLTVVPGGIKLKQGGLARLGDLLPKVGAAKAKALNRGAVIFVWLLRAWSQEDSISTFVSLFVPLEIVLQGYSGEGLEQHKEQAEAVECLIRQHGGEGNETLLEYFSRLKESWRPSLASRFEMIAREAEEAGIASREADVEAFKKFNRIRNALLHRGEGDVELQVTVGREENQGLEDLVERYVCFALFGNMNVYRRN